ncbi:MAG: glycosyltransferase [Lachnospiraceae bacterium]|jgi:rhamnosyltransferase|nr:glycosyltransferase [Lachnospiraceae bacterium]
MDAQVSSVDVIIPTYKPDKTFISLVKKLAEQHDKPNKIIVINTDKEYLDEDKYKDLFENIEFHHIEKETFNHGLTRNEGTKYSDARYILFMTQDAVPADNYLITELLRPFKNDSGVKLSYARQLPKKHCNYVERYTRRFNYPVEDIVKTKDSLKSMGIKAIFCSDVCAMYDREYFLENGGFEKTDFNEDQLFAYKLLMNGDTLYYASAARVFHSHNYSYIQQYKRNFQIGRTQKERAEIYDSISSESEGIKMVKAALSHMIRHNRWYMIPDLILCSGFKFIGFKMGQLSYRK